MYHIRKVAALYVVATGNGTIVFRSMRRNNCVDFIRANSNCSHEWEIDSRNDNYKRCIHCQDTELLAPVMPRMHLSSWIRK